MVTVLTILDSAGTLEEESYIEYIELQKHLSKQMKGDLEVENACEQDEPSEEQRCINRDYMQRRRASLATQNCHDRFNLNRQRTQ